MSRKCISIIKKNEDKLSNEIELYETRTQEIQFIVDRLPNLRKIYLDINKDEDALDYAIEWKTMMSRLILLENIKKIKIKCTNDLFVIPLIEGIDDAINIIFSCITLCERVSMNQLKICILFSRWCKMKQEEHIFKLISKIKKKFSINYKFQISLQFDCHNLLESEAKRLCFKYDLFLKTASKCRICSVKFSNNAKNILNCNACQDSYHLHCLKPQPKQLFYTNITWFCSLCAPTYHRVPMKFKKDNLKVPSYHEPLLIELNSFLTQYPFLECDLNPIAHKPLLSMKRIPLPPEKEHCGKQPRPGTTPEPHHGMSINWGNNI